MSRSTRGGAAHPRLPGRGSVLLAVVLAGGLAIAPGAAEAQEGCDFGGRGRNDVNSQVLPGIGRVTYVGGPHFVCAGGVQIFADSAVAYGDRGMSDFIGSVRYVEQGRELLADEARYFSNEGRLQAQGHVLLVDEAQGSSIQNGDLVYLLATEFRETSEMTVTVGADGIRPRVVLTPPPDTARGNGGAVADTGSMVATPDTILAAPPPPSDSADVDARRPYNVVADRHFIRGSGYFASSGDVVIERDSLFAYADSAEYEEGGDGLALVGDARVDGESYDLTGETITMTDPGGVASEIRALRQARLTGEDLLLTAARIVVVLQDGGLHRLVATPIAAPGSADADSVDLERPEADVEEFVLDADSLDVFAPGERLQRVFAAGRARSVSTARDSLNAEVLPEIARNDWLEGDTVIIRFVGSDPVPPMRTRATADSGAVEQALLDMDSASTGDTTAIDSLLSATGDTAMVAPGAEADTEAAAQRLPAPDSTASGDSLRVAAVIPESLVEPMAALGPDSSAVPDSITRGGPALAAADLLASQEPSEEAEVEEIIARIDARSLYRLPPNDSTFRAGTDGPAVHYVVGREIRIRLESGEVQGMSVIGQTRGVHLEPLPRGAPDSAAVADSVAVPDSGVVVDSAAVPDTGAVVDSATVPDTGMVGGDASPSERGPTARIGAPRPCGPEARSTRDEAGSSSPSWVPVEASRLPVEGPGTKIACIHARNAPERQSGSNGPPEEHPWRRP